MRKAFRASIYHCLDDPGEAGRESACAYLDDGLLIVENGVVTELGAADQLLPELGDDTPVEDYSGKLLIPGLIDCHVHYSQLDIIASYGGQLLDWLVRYAYAEEARFSDKDHCASVAGVFLDELLRNGTTTALVFTTVFPQSVDAIFEAAEQRNMRLIAGKVMMDRMCPENLRDDAESAYADSKELIERWHGQGRLGYAITPRFALTSSDEQLEVAGRLASEFPDTWVHTHLAENSDEIREIERLFPGSRSYLDVYERFGLLRNRSMFAHCLYLDEQDRDLMAERGAAAAFCPTSNLFLGSGLFDFQAMSSAGIAVGLATDVGGGTSLSMLRTMSEAYKVLQLQGQTLPANRALFLATLGAAQALGLDDRIGNLEVGKEADFVVLDAQGSGIAARRAQATTSIDEWLFSLIFLGDDRNIEATYLQGRLAGER